MLLRAGHMVVNIVNIWSPEYNWVINCLEQSGFIKACSLSQSLSNSVRGIKKIKTKLFPSSYVNVTTFLRQNYLINLINAFLFKPFCILT